MKSEKSIGSYLHEHRIKRGMSLKMVADHLDIDISLLSKIEHGDRQIQSYMLKGICDLFQLDYRAMQIEYLNEKIESEFGDEPYLIESLTTYINGKEKNR
jgi:transcriptional regulator with XRE-family HTH domain